MKSRILRNFYSRLFRAFFLCVFTSFGLASCDSPPADPVINFIGDSIIARWDVNQDFPSYCVYNYGVGGSGIELLESYAGRFTGQDIVVISGTNDNNFLKSGQREQYAEKYISTILSLTDSHIYLFSLLPREFETDRKDINKDIEAFNAIVSHTVKDMERIVYIDVFSDFIKDGKINDAYYCDGLHPNIIGYEILTQKLLKSL